MIDKNRIYAVVDTNVLVSALFSKNPSSNPAMIIEAVINGIITPIYNDDIISEYREVLAREKFKFNPELTAQLIRVFTEFGISTTRVHELSHHFPDPDDIVFYEVALSIEESFLITGNLKHFPKKPFIVTPAEMATILIERKLIN